MEKNLIRDWAYIKSAADVQDMYVTWGAFHGGGHIAGILAADSWIPKPPGHPGNATTFDFPVRYRLVGGADPQGSYGSDEALIPALVEAAKELELDGCRFIAASCGCFGRFQNQVAASVAIPVYLSAVMMVPWIRVGLRRHEKIGILCGDSSGLTDRVFKACGVSESDQARCVVYGMQDESVFSTVAKEGSRYDFGKARLEAVNTAAKMLEENPDLGAILFECADLPPHAAAVQAATNLPVFDTATMVKYAASVVCQKPYCGFV